MDMDDDLENTISKASDGPPSYDNPGRSLNRHASPLPAPVPQKPMPLPRESLDGETIFAVGDEDKLSDDESDDERRGLTER